MVFVPSEHADPNRWRFPSADQTLVQACHRAPLHTVHRWQPNNYISTFSDELYQACYMTAPQGYHVETATATSFWTVPKLKIWYLTPGRWQWACTHWRLCIRAVFSQTNTHTVWCENQHPVNVLHGCAGKHHQGCESSSKWEGTTWWKQQWKWQRREKPLHHSVRCRTSEWQYFKATIWRNCHVVWFGTSHSFWMQHHCGKYWSEVCNNVLM